jgi:hypothetical protein
VHTAVSPVCSALPWCLVHRQLTSCNEMKKEPECTGPSAGLQELREARLSRVSEALRMYARGHSKTDLATHYSVHRNTMNAWLRHIKRLHFRQVLTVLGPKHSDLALRLSNKAVCRVKTGCWEWVGKARSNEGGYGSIRYLGRQWVISRLVWTLVAGTPPDFVLHRCDNPPCFNPAHLFLGTHTDNMQDASRKGRLRGRRSSKMRSPGTPPGMFEWRGKWRPI